MIPARRLVLPILISLFLISSLFLAKQALAIWIFDFDPPTLELKNPSGTVIPNLGSEIFYQSSVTITLNCQDGTQAWNTKCQSISYALRSADPANFVITNNPDKLEPFTVSVTITPQANESSVKIFYKAIDNAGNTTPAQGGTFLSSLYFYPYKIQGYVWLDTNQNAIKNAGEDCYVGNPTISLSGDITAPDQTYSSDAGCLNTYSFSVPAGTFYVTLKNSSVPTYDLTCKTMKGGCANQQSWQQTVIITNTNSWAQWGITDAKVWWQTKLGDVRAGNGTITDTIPASCKGQCKPYLSLNSSGMHGIVFYAGSPPDFGSGSAAEPPPSAWLVNNSFSGALYSYDWIDGQTSQKLPFTGAQPVTSGVYKNSTDPTVTISSAWSVSPNLKIVVLVNGNLNINQTINFSPVSSTGGFLAFYVKGNINIDPNVSAANNRDNPQLEGIYVTDGYFNLGGGNRRLNIEGSVIAKQGLLNMRNLLGGNNTNPSFYVFYRPDFLLSAPSAVQSSSFIWQEIAP